MGRLKALLMEKRCVRNERVVHGIISWMNPDAALFTYVHYLSSFCQKENLLAQSLSCVK